MDKNAIHKSDKHFWHNYINFYETFFQDRKIESLAEIGIYKGDSIRWLMDRFPTATIYGADILPPQVQWPKSPRIRYTQLDQGSEDQLRAFLSQDKFDLIIEDGSHHPEHQALGLILGLERLTSGGLYILEDVHTSHPNYKKRWLSNRKGNSLTVLLALAHYIRIKKDLALADIASIARGSIFSEAQVSNLYQSISDIQLYRRTTLPEWCYSCEQSDYNFSKLECRCGAPIFSDTDSMSFVITVR